MKNQSKSDLRIRTRLKYQRSKISIFDFMHAGKRLFMFA